MLAILTEANVLLLCSKFPNNNVSCFDVKVNHMLRFGADFDLNQRLRAFAKLSLYPLRRFYRRHFLAFFDSLKTQGIFEVCGGLVEEGIHQSDWSVCVGVSTPIRVEGNVAKSAKSVVLDSNRMFYIAITTGKTRVYIR